MKAKILIDSLVTALWHELCQIIRRTYIRRYQQRRRSLYALFGYTLTTDFPIWLAGGPYPSPLRMLTTAYIPDVQGVSIESEDEFERLFREVWESYPETQTPVQTHAPFALPTVDNRARQGSSPQPITQPPRLSRWSRPLSPTPGSTTASTGGSHPGSAASIARPLSAVAPVLHDVNEETVTEDSTPNHVASPQEQTAIEQPVFKYRPGLINEETSIVYPGWDTPALPPYLLYEPPPPLPPIPPPYRPDPSDSNRQSAYIHPSQALAPYSTPYEPSLHSQKSTTNATPPDVSEGPSDDNPPRGPEIRSVDPPKRRSRKAWTEVETPTGFSSFVTELSMPPSSPLTSEAPLRPPRSSLTLGIAPVGVVPSNLPSELAVRPDEYSTLSQRSSYAAGQAREGYSPLPIPSLLSLNIEQTSQPLLQLTDDHVPTDSEDEWLPSSSTLRSIPRRASGSDIGSSRSGSSDSLYDPIVTFPPREVIGRPVPPARPATILSPQTEGLDPVQSRRLRNETYVASQSFPSSSTSARSSQRVAAAARTEVFNRSHHSKIRYPINLTEHVNFSEEDTGTEPLYVGPFTSRENILSRPKDSKKGLAQKEHYRWEEEERRPQQREIFAKQLERVRERSREEKVETRNREQEQKKREEERKKRKEMERKRIEEEERQRKEEAKRKEEELVRKEAEARRKEEVIRRWEEEIKAREEELRRRELEIATRRNQQPVEFQRHEEHLRPHEGGMEDVLHKSHHTIFPGVNISITEEVRVLKNSGVIDITFPLPGTSQEDDVLLPALRTVDLNQGDGKENNLVQAIGWFRMLFSNRERYQRLLNLKGTSAQTLVDILQELLDSQHLTESKLRKKIIVTLQQMASREAVEVFPSSCEVKDVIVPDDEHYMGSGGFGDIYRCLSGGRMVCVKVIRLSWLSLGDKFVKQFIKEGILWAQLYHRNVLPFQGFLRYQQRPCLLSPWMNNGHILEFLKNNPSVDRYLLVRDITNGLNYLHSWGIVHGDLKGGNVLIDDCGHACLSDFGISSVFDATLPHWTTQSTLASKGGSVRWQAPELLNGDDDGSVNNTIATDVYAWACVCYEIFTQQVPLYELAREATITLRVAYQGLRPSRPSEGSSPWCAWGLQQSFWELMENCWITEPEKRPSVETLLATPQLVEALDERTNDAHPEPTSRYRTSKRLHTALPMIEDLERVFMSDADPL